MSDWPFCVSISITNRFMRPQLGAVAARYFPEPDNVSPSSRGLVQMSSTLSCFANRGGAGVCAIAVAVAVIEIALSPSKKEARIFSWRIRGSAGFLRRCNDKSQSLKQGCHSSQGIAVGWKGGRWQAAQHCGERQSLSANRAAASSLNAAPSASSRSSSAAERARRRPCSSSSRIR